LEVWGDPAGLDGRDIRPDDLGVGEFIGEISILVSTTLIWHGDVKGHVSSYIAQMPVPVPMSITVYDKEDYRQ